MKSIYTLALAVLLTACGGSSDSESTFPTAPVIPLHELSANQLSENYKRRAREMHNGSSDELNLTPKNVADLLYFFDMSSVLSPMYEIIESSIESNDFVPLSPDSFVTIEVPCLMFGSVEMTGQRINGAMQESYRAAYSMVFNQCDNGDIILNGLHGLNEDVTSEMRRFALVFDDLTVGTSPFAEDLKRHDPLIDITLNGVVNTIFDDIDSIAGTFSRSIVMHTSDQNASSRLLDTDYLKVRDPVSFDVELEQLEGVIYLPDGTAEVFLPQLSPFYSDYPASLLSLIEDNSSAVFYYEYSLGFEANDEIVAVNFEPFSNGMTYLYTSSIDRFFEQGRIFRSYVDFLAEDLDNLQLEPIDDLTPLPSNNLETQLLHRNTILPNLIVETMTGY